MKSKMLYFVLLSIFVLFLNFSELSVRWIRTETFEKYKPRQRNGFFLNVSILIVDDKHSMTTSHITQNEKNKIDKKLLS